MPELGPAAAEPRRGRLLIYLGAAPGVGKTYAMLSEGRRLADGGADVVVGIAETHGRRATEALLGALPCLPPRSIHYRDAMFAELDLDAILTAHPAVVLVDELAHSNAPGSRHDKRWQDVETLLDAGIDVVSNLNVQHLSSLADEVAHHTGVVDPETVPDDFVGSADRIELVDFGAETLRERLDAGLLYGPDQSAIARERFFRADRLLVLRELAGDWLAQRDVLRDAEGNRVGGSEPVKSRRAPVVVSLNGAPDGERVVRRAAAIAAHSHSELVGIHVRQPTGLVQSESGRLVRQRELLLEAGGRYAEVAGVDEGTTILEFVHAEQADHLVIGVTRHSWWTGLRRSSIVHRILRSPSAPELHLVTIREPPEPTRGHPLLRTNRSRVSLPWARRRLGWLLAVFAPALAIVVLLPWRSSVGVAGALFGALTAVVLVAALGGIGPAILATTVGFLGADFLYTHPYYSLRVDGTLDVVALIAFVVVAGVVVVLVDRLARQGMRTARERAEADAVARLLANSVTAAPAALPDLADELRTAFGLEVVEFVRDPHGRSTVLATTGSPDCPRVAIELADRGVLVLEGARITERDAELLREFVRQLQLNERAGQLSRARTHRASNGTTTAR